MPWYFKIYLIIAVYTLTTGIIRRLFKNKYKLLLLSTPKDKRDKLKVTYLTLIKIYKILFFLTPIYLVALPYLLYRYSPHDFIYMTAILIYMYLLLLEDIMFRKSMVKELQEIEDRQLSSG